MIYTSLSANAAHLPVLITDLGLILITASIAVLVFRKLKQPLVLGYLVAGFLAGSNFDFFPTVADSENISIWAEIGIIFLLFSLGLEFSFKKLAKVGGAASITALTQIVFMVFIGFSVGKLMGWTDMNSLFLGAMLSMSSTTIILKAFDELGVKSRKFAGIVFGALIVEDIVAIVMMVLLSTIAVSQQFSGTELLISVLKLLFFLTLWFIGGIFFIPTLLKKAKNLLTDETTLILSIALCLMMVVLATKAGFSPALGAFIMGSIIAETSQAQHIEHLLKPVKDLFGAVFFVSVGMLININTLVEYATPVLIITMVTILGKAISSMGGALLSGQPLRQSVQAGMSLAQIGEFSFIIATLGMSLKVTSDFLYPIIVAVSAITTFTTPFFIKIATPFAETLERKLPKRWIKAIDRYSANTQAIKPTSAWRRYVNFYITKIIINSVITIAILLVSKFYIQPFFGKFQYGNFITALVTFIGIAPFLWAISFKKNKELIGELFKDQRYKGAVIIMFIFRLLLSLFFIGAMLTNIFSYATALVLLVLLIAVYFAFPKWVMNLYYYFENRFLVNFNQNTEITEPEPKKVKRQNLTPWDGHIAGFTVPVESNLVGLTIEELKIRENFGVNIAFIKRKDQILNIPSKKERIYPNDELHIIGTDVQVGLFKDFLETNIVAKEQGGTDIVLWKLELQDKNLSGKTIRESMIREKTNSIVVGIEKNGQRILNPESTVLLEENDILWIVGDRNKMKVFIEPI